MSKSDFENLIRELDELDENDPDGDIASGDRIIEDGLFDGGDEDNAEADASTASAETKAAEPKPQSILRQWLASVKDTVMKEIIAHDMPLCYLNGDFWIRPRHPAFALRHAATVKYSPRELYHRDVFLWLPMHLSPETTFYCTCGLKLTKNGMFSDHLILSCIYI